jgi:hypothetical protein
MLYNLITCRMHIHILAPKCIIINSLHLRRLHRTTIIRTRTRLLRTMLATIRHTPRPSRHSITSRGHKEHRLHSLYNLQQQQIQQNLVVKLRQRCLE